MTQNWTTLYKYEDGLLIVERYELKKGMLKKLRRQGWKRA